MKIKIDCPNIQIQASWYLLENKQGGKINIYFFSGGRYDHSAYVCMSNSGEILFRVSRFDDEENEIGKIVFTAETDDEKQILAKPIIWHSRNKETDSFLVLPFDFSNTYRSTLIYERNF